MFSATRVFPAGAARHADTSALRLVVPAALIVGLAIAVRAYDIDTQSLWTDELFSRYYPDLFSLRFLWTTGLLHENSPPLYYMAIEGWMRLFGTSATAMRSLSLVASLLTLPLVYLLGRELLDDRRGLLAMLVFALSPMQIAFSQEARTYSLLLVPVGIALFGITRFLGGDTRKRVLCLYGLGALFALYCHATALFLIAACNIVVIATLLSDRQAGWQSTLTRWIYANALIGVLAVPELIAIVVQGRADAGLNWIPPLRPVHVIRALSPVIVGTSTPDRFPGAELSLLLLACLGGALWLARPKRRVWLVLVAIPATYVALLAIVSLYHSIFIARAFCWLGIPLALLLAHGLAQKSRLRPVLATVAAVACATGLAYQFTVQWKEPWRDLLAQLGPQFARADDMVLAPATDPTPFAYYAPYLNHLQVWDAVPHYEIEQGALRGLLGAQWITREQLVADIRSGQHVWLVVRTPDLPRVDKLLAAVPPPTQRIERSCGKVVCIVALSW